MSVVTLLSNKSPLPLDETERYAAIVGLAPSQGARSPALWNAVFASSGASARMLPFDVAEQALPQVVRELKGDKRFLGGAVAAPYKTRVVELLDGLDEEASLIGAVNAIYRSGNKLIGTNTDGAAAVTALKSKIGGDIAGAHVVLLGAGGAGSAVATYLAKAIGKSGRLVIANRNLAPANTLAEKLSRWTATKACTLNALELTGCTIVVNCTSVGMEMLRVRAEGTEYLRPFSPLAEVGPPVPDIGDNRAAFMQARADSISRNVRDSIALLSKLPPSTIYDIIYQPKRTLLLELAECSGHRTLNGEDMNIQQAVIAFEQAAHAATLPVPPRNEIAALMRKTAQTL